MLVQKGGEVIALLDVNDNGLFEKRLVANNLQNPAGVTYFEGDYILLRWIQFGLLKI